MSDVEHDCNILVEWFRINYMTLNVAKCHLLVSGMKDEAMFAKFDGTTIWEEDSVKLLGLIIDSDLSFNSHIKMICKKASKKLTAILRMVRFISQKKRRVLVRTFFESQFNYCPLLWMLRPNS